MGKLIGFLRPYALPIAIGVALIFVQSMADLYLPNIMSDIVNTGIVAGDTEYILGKGGVMLLVTLAGMAATIAAAYLGSKVAMGFGRDVRSAVFRKVSSFSLSEFDRLGASTLITRATNDVTQVQTFVMIFLRMVVAAPIMCVGGIIMGTAKDGSLVYVLLVAVPVLAVAIGIVAAKGLPLFRSVQGKTDAINLVTREAITGIRVARAFNREGSERARFDAANADLAGTALKAQRIMFALMPIMMFAMNATTIAIIWFGGIRVDAGQMLIGDMMAFLQYAMQILFSLVMVSMMFVFYPRAAVSAKRIREVLDVENEIVDPVSPKAPSASAGLVEFRGVSFSYHGAEEPALKDVSFTARPGELTAIIGGTGSGKSTIANLIPRFYDASAGQVLVGGIDVRDMTQAELRSRIGYAPQTAVLFSGSVADNIRYGKPDASDEEVAAAAATAQAADFIAAMPEGYDSKLAQGGTNLSGGQKQRLAIARALAREAAIYVFDDSFSALDFKTDARLRAALREKAKGATLIVVAQRINTVMRAENIVVLDEGRVVGQGRHEELLASCPVYREIAASQLSEEELA